MKKALTLLITIASAALLGFGQAAAEERYRFGSGPTGGAWPVAIGPAVQLLNENLKGRYYFQHTPSQGSVANVRQISLGDVSTAWGHIIQVYSAWSGLPPYEDIGKQHGFRVVANVQMNSQIVAVLADSPIKSFSDMEGKVVSLLARGSGASANCVNVFTALGLYPDKIKERFIGYAESTRALTDRQIDVFCSGGTPFTHPSVTQVSVSKPVRYISMTEAEQRKAVEKFRFYSPITIPIQKEVRGMDAPARTIGYGVWWIAGKGMSDDAVYNMVKVIADPVSQKSLATAGPYWKDLGGDFQPLKELGILVHPAAARYWKERGVDVPPEIVKGF